MFGWFKRRKSSYSDREKRIFSYWNGERWVRADPVALYKRVMDVGPELSVDIKVARSPLKDAGKAHEKLSAKLRDIFNLKPLTDGIEVIGTLSDNEAGQLLDEFLAWCEDLKKNSRQTSTSAEATSPSTPSEPAAGPATPSSSDSGSTATGPSTGQPGPSPTEPESPSEPSSPASTSTGA